MRAFLVALILILSNGSVQAWYDQAGEKIPGRAVEFSFSDKTLELEESNGALRAVPTWELSLRSRQRLLLSPLFHRSYPTDSLWPPEKRRLLLVLALGPALFLLTGFWGAGAVLTRNFNPLRACAAFVGSWIIGTLFVLFYLFFAARLGGGIATVLFGTGLGLVFLSFYISVIYHCDVFRGLLIFLFQVVAGLFFLVVALALSELILPEDVVQSFWNERIFVPVGLVERPDFTE